MRGIALRVVLVVGAMAVENARLCLARRVAPLRRGFQQVGDVQGKVLVESREKLLSDDRFVLVPVGRGAYTTAMGAFIGARLREDRLRS